MKRVELKCSTFHSPPVYAATLPASDSQKSIYPLPHKSCIISLLCSLPEPHLFVMCYGIYRRLCPIETGNSSSFTESGPLLTILLYHRSYFMIPKIPSARMDRFHPHMGTRRSLHRCSTLPVSYTVPFYRLPIRKVKYFSVGTDHVPLPIPPEIHCPERIVMIALSLRFLLVHGKFHVFSILINVASWSVLE